MSDPGPRLRVRDRRKAGYFRIDNELMSTFGPELGPNGLAVYCALAYHTNSQDAASWPSVPRIARETGASVATVRRMIERLERLQLIEVREAFDHTGQMPSEYFLLEVPAAVPAGWSDGPRPERVAVSYANESLMPPQPAANRTRPPITQIAPPNHTDTPPLSESEAAPVREIGPPLTRRNERYGVNKPPKSPDPIGITHDPVPAARARGRARIELMKELNSYAAAGSAAAPAAAIAAEFALDSDELYYIADAARRPSHWNHAAARFVLEDLLPALDAAGYDYRAKEPDHAAAG